MFIIAMIDQGGGGMAAITYIINYVYNNTIYPFLDMNSEFIEWGCCSERFYIYTKFMFMNM